MSDDQNPQAPKPGQVLARGSKAGQAPGPSTREVGDVAFVPAFLGGFVIHTEDEAYGEAEKFRHLAPVAIYRIEIIDVLEKTDAPTPSREA